MLNEEVLVSFSFTPVVFNTSITLFIIFEFAVNAIFAVLLVVSTPKETITLSGFSIVVAIPITDTILFENIHPITNPYNEKLNATTKLRFTKLLLFKYIICRDILLTNIHKKYQSDLNLFFNNKHLGNKRM